MEKKEKLSTEINACCAFANAIQSLLTITLSHAEKFAGRSGTSEEHREALREVLSTLQEFTLPAMNRLREELEHFGEAASRLEAELDLALSRPS